MLTSPLLLGCDALVSESKIEVAAIFLVSFLARVYIIFHYDQSEKNCAHQMVI